MESVRLKINEHMTSVGEEILCVLDKQQQSAADAVCCVKFVDVRVFVLERLREAAEVMCNLFQREMETLHNTQLHTAEHHRERSTESREMASQTALSEEQQETDKGRGLFDATMEPVVKLHRIDQCAESSLKVKMSWSVSVKQEPENYLDINFLPLPVCKEELFPEHEERSPSLLQEEPQPPQTKEEPEEQQEEDGSTLTLLAVKSEGVDENRETEAVASTSTEHMQTQADVEDCGTSQPTSGDQLLSPHCSQSDVTEDSDEQEETREGRSVLNTLDSKSQNVEGQTLSASHKLSQDLPRMRTHTQDKPFACTVCGKGCSKMGNLKSHMRAHTGEKPFTCTVCGKGFSQSSNLKTHTRNHKGGRSFTCTVCGKGFNEKGNLKSHMRTHEGEKPFTCNVCGKGCSQNGELKVHMRIHTGEKPFTCTVFGKGCVHIGNLKAHMRTHTGEKPFTCTVCGKGCSQSGHLKSHMRTHTGEKPFTCTVCGKGCSRSDELKAHMSTHTGEKPFTCTVCGKGFVHSGDLKAHMRIHTGEKPFMCTVCGKGCSQMSHLKIHMRTHTGENGLQCCYICNDKLTEFLLKYSITSGAS